LVKDKIICLVGESGSGKTTVCQELEKQGYNIIKSYTTRKPRYEGEYGHTFVDEEEWMKGKDLTNGLGMGSKNSSLIAYTYFAGHHYWMTKEQFEGKGTSIYIVDIGGVKTLKQNKPEATKVVVIYLATTEVERLNRMKNRTLAQMIDPKPEELFKAGEIAMARIKHDREAFKDLQYNFLIDAENSIDSVVNSMKVIIK